MNDEVWVLDATGRTGQATAMRPHQASIPIVPVGPELAEAVGGKFVVGQDVSPVKAGATRTPANTAAWFGGKQGRLEVIQAGFDVQKRGVSAKNVVVSL